MEDRLLGVSTNVRFPTWCVWVATANNARITEDVASRTIVIDLDTNEENPEEREFKNDPLAYIKANRGQVCGAIITLVRAWQEAGCPAYSGPNRTRFPQWQRVMGGILQTVGIEGFLDNASMGGARLGDDDASATAELVGFWWDAHGQTPRSASELYPLVAKVPVVAGSLVGNNDAAKERSWSQKLSRVVNRRFGGYKIVAGPLVNRRNTYQLVPPEETNSPEETPTDAAPPAPKQRGLRGRAAVVLMPIAFWMPTPLLPKGNGPTSGTNILIKCGRSCTCARMSRSAIRVGTQTPGRSRAFAMLTRARVFQPPTRTTTGFLPKVGNYWTLSKTKTCQLPKVRLMP